MFKKISAYRKPSLEHIERFFPSPNNSVTEEELKKFVAGL